MVRLLPSEGHEIERCTSATHIDEDVTEVTLPQDDIELEDPLDNYEQEVSFGMARNLGDVYSMIALFH
jgi:hypothetical protein